MAVIIKCQKNFNKPLKIKPLFNNCSAIKKLNADMSADINIAQTSIHETKANNIDSIDTKAIH